MAGTSSKLGRDATFRLSSSENVVLRYTTTIPRIAPLGLTQINNSETQKYSQWTWYLPTLGNNFILYHTVSLLSQALMEGLNRGWVGRKMEARLAADYIERLGCY